MKNKNQKQLPSQITGGVVKEVAKSFQVKTVWAVEALNKIYSKSKEEALDWLKDSFKKEFPNAGKQEKLCMKELIRISYAVPGLKTVTDLKDIKKAESKEEPSEKAPKDKKEKKEKREKATPKSTELREVYNYPKDCENKKAYRVKMRKQKADLLDAIAKAKDEKEKAKAEKAYADFRKSTYIE